MHTKNTRYSVGCLSSRIFLTSYILPFKFPAAAAAVTTNCTMSVLIFTSIHNILQPLIFKKIIISKEPHQNVDKTHLFWGRSMYILPLS